MSGRIEGAMAAGPTAFDEDLSIDAAARDVGAGDVSRHHALGAAIR